jgi:hypothetical protein
MPLQPRLGNFVGREDQIPYDYDDLLGMIAPRPIYVFHPKLGYQADSQDLKTCLQQAMRVFDLYGARDHLRLFELDDYNRFSPESQQVIYEQFRMMAGLPATSKP